MYRMWTDPSYCNCVTRINTMQLFTDFVIFYSPLPCSAKVEFRGHYFRYLPKTITIVANSRGGVGGEVFTFGTLRFAYYIIIYYKIIQISTAPYFTTCPRDFTISRTVSQHNIILCSTASLCISFRRILKSKTLPTLYYNINVLNY